MDTTLLPLQYRPANAATNMSRNNSFNIFSTVLKFLSTHNRTYVAIGL